MDSHAWRFAAPPQLAALPPPTAVHTLLACYGLLVLVTAAIFGALDRQVLVLLAEPIRHSLNLSDTKLGLLQGVGITLFSAVLAVPLGWLADRYGRRGVLAACVLAWAGATVACGMAHSFSALFAASIGLGLGEAGMAPIVYGLIPDIVPERRRALANGVYTLAVIVGSGVGMAASGALVESLDHLRPLLPPALQALEPWRLAFLAIALPGPLMALAALLIRLHPHRGGADAGDGPDPAGDGAGLPAYVRAHGRTLASVFGGSGLLALALAASANWAPIVAVRVFGATAAQAGEGIGVAYMAGTAAGALLGVAGVRLLRRRVGLATPIRVITLGATVAALASLLMPAVQGAAGLYWLFGIQVVALIAGSMLVPTLLQDMTPVALRSRLIALGTGVTVGLSALSPVLVGALSDLQQPGGQGLLVAMACVGAAGFALAAAVMLTAEEPFVRTVKQIHPGLALREA